MSVDKEIQRLIDERRINEGNLDIKLRSLAIVLEPMVRAIIEEQRAKEIKESPLLTIEDIARKFKVTKATVHNWKKRGSIIGQKLGKNRYFTEEEVRKSLAKEGFTKQWD